jgi:hypothetical protein|tara:strand:- start:40 stop:330 length:291 start_codon:yes stop_codon:yes gene_type:complete
MACKVLIALALLASWEAKAEDGLWLASKAEVGYNEYFVVGGLSIGQEGITKASTGTGVKVRLGDSFKLEPICGLSMERNDLWKPYPYLKLKLEVRL